jgi:hypothetical protein
MLTAVLSASISTSKEYFQSDEKCKIPITEAMGGFKLPICYVKKDAKHDISEVVSSDLELLHPNTDTDTDNTDKNSVTVLEEQKGSMYSILMQPTHEFGVRIMKKWNRQFTSDVEYLEQTQEVVANMEQFSGRNPHEGAWECCRIMKIWKELKENEMFLEKYGYMEWNSLKFLNENSTFLQGLTIIQVISPLMSVIIPIILLTIPFLILKVQRINITWSTYLHHLKMIAKTHIIGKAIQSFEEFSLKSVVYFIGTFLFYLLQVYQNVFGFIKFYGNVQSMNSDLLQLRDFVEYSIINMDLFIALNSGYHSYRGFIADISLHKNVLLQLKNELDSVRPFSNSVGKLVSVGYMMKCYYDLHSNIEYERSIGYAFGFEGYLDNMRGVYGHLCSGNVNIAQFNGAGEAGVVTEKFKEKGEEKEEEKAPSAPTCVSFKQIYYPSHCNNAVKNDISLNKNMIITGVNASGKTTTLKTVAINTILTQQFGMGFYESCNMIPYHHIHSYLNIPDTSERDSLFQAESRRCKEIIDFIGDRRRMVEEGKVEKKRENKGYEKHLCILDELYSGTNPVEATKASFAFLKYITQFENVDFILTTHYTSICDKIDKEPRIANYNMHIVEDDSGNVAFTYKLVSGICNTEGAINILKNMEYPKEIIQEMMDYK